MKRLSVLILGIVCLSVVGCQQPYDVPVFVEVGNSETAFMVKKTDNSKQTSTKAEMQFLQKTAEGKPWVQDKRIIIPYTWMDMGRGENNGKYLPDAQVIIIDRKPVAREWTAASHTGTSAKDEALHVESSDSVNYSCGISIVARIISEEDANKFLFNYPANRDKIIKSPDPTYKDDYIVKTVGLEDVMDTEVRALLQKVFSEQSALYTMEDGRSKKTEMMKAMKKEADAYFAERGITITSIGMVGGLTYENPDIQLAIDKTFKSQMDKVNAKAEFDAAVIRKTALKEAGEGEAAKILAIKEGEAKGITLVADALERVQGNPMYMMQKFLETWNGVSPNVLVIGGNGQMPSMLLSTDPSKFTPSLPKPKPVVTPLPVAKPAEAAK